MHVKNVVKLRNGNYHCEVIGVKVRAGKVVITVKVGKRIKKHAR